MGEFNFPQEGEHTTILGTTGSGKSTLGAWIVSKSPFHLRPHFVIDFKYEEIFARLNRAREIGTHETLPNAPGLYILRPRPDQLDEVEDWLRRLWEHGTAGLYIDEGYLMPDRAWFKNLLAQGRALGISVVTTSQRPVDIPRSVFTEATHVAVFRLNDKKDMQRVAEFTPPGMLEKRLPDFHSFWYSPKYHKADDPFPYVVLSPVPGADAIIETIESRLKPKHTVV